MSISHLDIKGNEQVLNNLKMAMEAVYFLKRKNIPVSSVSLDGVKPRLYLSRPPSKHVFTDAKWSTCRNSRKGSGREYKMIALLSGCKVMWWQQGY